MLCKNVFCIYWQQENYILSKVSMDIQGRCEECIYVDIDEDRLEKDRNQTLHSFIDEYPCLYAARCSPLNHPETTERFPHP